ncbi:glycosyltransferase family 22 protein [Scleroderma citrinum Foug A]|uniref:Mannosyltransferase n=1 Tax=Scleroderma citrinum Foug A TaxID=1036808 RepID=A0A0C3DIE5_9AGAM|nr:glycosyltransferase family 22 protein [Scleroderma citrinum Foug A]
MVNFSRSAFRWIYAALWVIRVLFALYGTGYIHPDEHMQNAEITAADILGYHTMRSWEWNPAFPLRAVIPIYMTSGLPFFFAQKLYSEPFAQTLHPTTLFRLERLSFLCLSSLLDVSVAILVPPPMRSFALLLLSSSYVTHAFYVRPFSNSLEAVIVALCLVCLKKIVWISTLDSNRKNEKNERAALNWHLHALAALGTFGASMRPTFFGFALPICLQMLRFSYKISGTLSRTTRLLAYPVCSGILTALCCIAVDALYYRGSLRHPVFPSLNFLKYNSSTDNLAEHGLHPRWLHLFVNLPMLISPWLWCLAVRGIYHSFKDHTRSTVEKAHAVDVVRETIAQIIVISLAILSTLPHQEPRFLCPMILPVLVLVATSTTQWPKKTFWVMWIIFNLVFAVVFGVLHQAGVVPSLFYLHSRIANDPSANTHIIYWKTYMPPRRFLGIPQQDAESGKVDITDLAGASQETLIDNLLPTGPATTTYVVTPVPMYKTLPSRVSPCFTPQTRIFPHLDLDHVRASIDAGLYDGLALGVYTVERSCVITATRDA